MVSASAIDGSVFIDASNAVGHCAERLMRGWFRLAFQSSCSAENLIEQ